MTVLRQKIWRTARIVFAFYKNRDGSPRAEPKIWEPENGKVFIPEDPADKTAMIHVATGSEATSEDVAIGFYTDEICLRRGGENGWKEVVVTEENASFELQDRSVSSKGSEIFVKTPHCTVTIDEHGSVFVETPKSSVSVSPCGKYIERRTPDNLAIIGENSVDLVKN